MKTFRTRAQSGPAPSPPATEPRGFSEAAPAQRVATVRHALSAAEGRRDRPGELPFELRAGIEALSGVPVDDVRVHRNSPHPATVEAAAFTRGNQIHIAPGQDHHLAHEAWHVVQQKQRRVLSNGSVNGVPLNNSESLEREAETMGRMALRSAPPATMPMAESAPAASADAVQRVAQHQSHDGSEVPAEDK